VQQPSQHHHRASVRVEEEGVAGKGALALLGGGAAIEQEAIEAAEEGAGVECWEQLASPLATPTPAVTPVVAATAAPHTEAQEKEAVAVQQGDEEVG
jgi:hypothetical protein